MVTVGLCSAAVCWRGHCWLSCSSGCSPGCSPPLASSHIRGGIPFFSQLASSPGGGGGKPLLTGTEINHGFASLGFQDDFGIFSSGLACLVDIQDAVESRGGWRWYHGAQERCVTVYFCCRNQLLHSADPAVCRHMLLQQSAGEYIFPHSNQSTGGRGTC